MPHDINGNILNVGDEVLLRCKITSISPSETQCNITAEAVERPEGEGYIPTISGNSRFYLKASAFEVFSGAKPPADAEERVAPKSSGLRTLTEHKLNGLNEALEITVLDEPGQGGACHKYAIELSPRPFIFGASAEDCKGACAESTNGEGSCLIQFQNGPIQEAGVNGISAEALLAVIIDRLRCFQAGPYASNENMHALVHATGCLEWLQKRTRDRLARGVEGTSQK